MLRLTPVKLDEGVMYREFSTLPLLLMTTGLDMPAYTMPVPMVVELLLLLNDIEEFLKLILELPDRYPKVIFS